MAHLIAIFEHAAVTHEQSAAVHDRAAVFFEQRGNLEAAGRERDRARKDRREATEDRQRALRRRELLRQATPGIDSSSRKELPRVVASGLSRDSGASESVGKRPRSRGGFARSPSSM